MDSFLKNLMKKCIFNVELMKSPIFNHCKAKDDANCSWLDNRAICFIIVYTLFLVVPFGYKANLKSIDRPIRLQFCFNIHLEHTIFISVV